MDRNQDPDSKWMSARAKARADEQARIAEAEVKAKAALAELNLFFASPQGVKIWVALTRLADPLGGDVVVGPQGADVPMTFFAMGRASLTRELLKTLDPVVAAELVKGGMNAAV